MEKCPVAGTYCSDPKATHTVVTGDPTFGYGIFGYYTSQWDAFRVRRFLNQHNAKHVSVEDYDPGAEVIPGMHAMVEAHFGGFI